MGIVLGLTSAALAVALVAAAWLWNERRQLTERLDDTRTGTARSAARVAAAELAVRRVQRDLDRLVWVTAIDARSPTVSAHDELVTLRRSRGERLQAAERQMLDKAISDTNHAVRLLDEVRDWALAEAPEPNLSSVNLRQVLDRALVELDHDGNATMDVGTLPDVVTDLDALAPALHQVLDNCIRYRWPNRPVNITVAAETSATHATLTVLDDGIGIALEDPDLLFLPFARGDGAAAMPGIGLGLARARRTIEGLGGTIRFLPRPPEHESRGTTVEIKLPLTPARIDAGSVEVARVTVAAP